MQATGGRQSRRIMKQRNAETQSPDSPVTRYVSERSSPGEMHHARLVMILFGLAFLGACVAYVVAAAGQVLG